jgi:phage terminase large subunit-like protein
VLATYPATKIGPTWQIDEDGYYILPEFSLGWEILGWITEWLLSPDGSGDPFELTDEQARFVIWFYAIDKRGKFLNKHGVLQRLKGWGKDPLGAALCIVELAGPCRFSHWGEDGRPVGRQHRSPYVQVGAVSLEQTENTRDLFPVIIPPRTAAEFNLDVQTEIIYARGRGKLKCVASNPRTNEGGRISFFLAGETHHWVDGNGARKFYRTLRNNLKKNPDIGRFLAITNAYQPGENSVAEDIREDQQMVWDGLKKSNGFLYDSLEAHPKAPMDPEVAPYILETVMGDAWWLKAQIPEIVEGFSDQSIPLSQHRRMWFNQIVSTEESAFSIDEVEAIMDRSMTGTINDLKPGDKITLGFDGGRTDDATALVAYRLADRCLIPIQIWEKPDNVQRWEISTEDVDSMVGYCFSTYDVVAFFADMELWESYIAQWSELFREKLRVRASGRSSIGYDMRGNQKDIASLNETFIGMVRDQQIKINNHGRLRTHFLNAERRWTGGHLKFGKKGGRESARKIDGLIAATLAFKASLEFAERGAKEVKKKQPGRLYQW